MSDELTSDELNVIKTIGDRERRGIGTTMYWSEVGASFWNTVSLLTMKGYVVENLSGSGWRLTSRGDAICDAQPAADTTRDGERADEPDTQAEHDE